MESLLELFPIILYGLGIVLLVILIILGIKLIHTVDRTNDLLEDAYNKSKSLNGIFDKVFKKKPRKKKKENEDYE